MGRGPVEGVAPDVFAVGVGGGGAEEHDLQFLFWWVYRCFHPSG